MTEPLSQLMPFNRHRFDACMTYLCRKHNRSLTIDEMMKLHVMTDVFHVLKYGRPMIGGKLEAWKPRGAQP